MLIFGLRGLKSPRFRRISTISDIAKSSNDEIVWLEFEHCGKDFELFRHCADSEIPFAVKIRDVQQLLIAANFGAKFIIFENLDSENCAKKLAKKFQKIADNYMLDSKILCVIDDLAQIENLARVGLDGVIFRELIL